MLKKANDDIKRNSFWITQLNEKAVLGTCDILTYIETIEGISIEDVNKFVKKIFKKADKFEVMMVGTKK